MSINSLSNKNAPNVVASAPLQSNGATEVRKRKKWTMEMNIFIIREYFRITKLQDVVSTYRLDLFKAFQSKYPQFPVTIQNLADQRRAIMKKNYIPSAILEKIKNDVKLELSINYSDNNEVSNNLLQNSVEPQSLQSLSNHNDSFCPILDSPNTIQTDIHNLDLSYNDIHVINKNFYYHQNFKEQIEDEFNRTLNEFEHIEPFNRPLLRKQQSSKKFFAMIEILNQFILPKFVNNTTSFKKLHSIIYSGALTIIRLNGSKEIGQTNNIKRKNYQNGNNVINTRNYKKHICGLQSIIDKCRICGTEGETIEHIISSCTVLAQSEYKKRHDIFAKIIHMNLAVKFNLLKNTQPHYSYTPESCLENDSYKLYFDRTILTDIHIKHNRPDIIILNKQQKQAHLLDIAVPNSHNITQTYNTKINKYLELSVAMRNLWCLEKNSILPLVISATGIVPQSLFKNLKILDLDNTLVVEIQKGILLYSCHIVRKFLNIDTEHNTQQSQNAEARRR
jgi:hypothetical protein